MPGLVDVLTGGIPCQGWSLAGKRRGSDDERDLWPVRKFDAEGHPRRGAIDAIRALRPALFLFENVASLLTAERGFPWGTVLADLDALGYAVSWTTVGACRVGACHHRHRIFLAATRAEVNPPAGCPVARRAGGAWVPIQDVLFGGTEAVRWPASGIVRDGRAWALPVDTCGTAGIVLPTPRASDGRRGAEPIAAGRTHRGTGPALGDVAAMLPTPTARDATRGAGWGEQTGRPLSEVIALLPAPRASDAVKGGPNQRGSSGDLMLPSAVKPERFGAYAAAVRHQEAAFGRAAPDPTEPGRAGRPRLAAPFAEWLMGLPPGWITDHIARADAIRLAGNGVIPQQAAYALPGLPTFRAAVTVLAGAEMAVAA